MQILFSHSHKALRVICMGFPEPSVERQVDATATTSVSVGASTYPTLKGNRQQKEGEGTRTGGQIEHLI